MPDFAGPILSLVCAFFWAVSPMFMASAGRRVGSIPVVLIRSLLATILLSLVLGSLLAAGVSLQFPDRQQISWLSVSGVTGMCIGDLLVYEAFVTLGPRRTIQLLVLAPAVTVVVAWVLLDEVMTGRMLVAIALILVATLYAVIARRDRRPPTGQERDVVISGGESGDVEVNIGVNGCSPAGNSVGYAAPPPSRTEPGRVTTLGVAFAIGGAICMGVGGVTTRCAFRAGNPLDPLSATFVRVASGAVALWIVPLLTGRWMQILRVLRDPHVLRCVAAGTLLGPFVGMFCYVLAFKLLSAGLVSTLVATTPLFSIPITWLRYRSRIGWDVCAAALVASMGVALLFCS